MTRFPRLERAPFGEAGSLGATYAARDPSVLDLFPSWVELGEQSLAAVHGVPGPLREGLRSEDFGATSSASREKLEAILAGQGTLVTTGQQPGMFLGSLLVLYKALTAIALASTLERRFGHPVLALFWVASDDHDWREVGATRVIDTTNDLQSLRFDPPAGRSDRAVGSTCLDMRVSALLAALRDVFPETEFRDQHLKLLEAAYQPGRRIGQAFGEALAGVLADHELVWLDSARPAVSRALGPLYQRALEETTQATDRLLESTERVRAAGFDPQLLVPDRASNVFFDDAQGRRRVHVEGGSVRLGSDGEPRPLEALLSELRRTPEAFSPSAALRPVAESALLPVAASVLGPAEVAYWAQLPGLFSWAGVPMPRVVPRTAWTVIEAKIASVLEDVGASSEELRDGGDRVIERAVRQETPTLVSESLEELASTQEAAFDHVVSALGAELPGIRATGEKARASARRVYQDLEKGVAAAVRDRQRTLTRRVRKAATHLYPGGGAQERVLNPLYYLVRYGPGFVADLDREVRAAVEEYVACFSEGR